ncbi:dephospho-CoA kinase [Phascolarctobacterium faecium]
MWLVAVDEQTQIERAIARSGMSQQEVEVRIAAQMTLAAKLSVCGFDH